jgi:hypothetical protein
MAICSSRIHADHFPVYQGICNFLMSPIEDVPESLPGYAHLFRRFTLIQSFEICQADSFQLIGFKMHCLKCRHAPSPGLENLFFVAPVDPSVFYRPGHHPSVIGIC